MNRFVVGCRLSNSNRHEAIVAVRFGPCTFGVVDAFPEEAARGTHLEGPVGKALAAKADELSPRFPTSAMLSPDVRSLHVVLDPARPARTFGGVGCGGMPGANVR